MKKIIMAFLIMTTLLVYTFGEGNPIPVTVFYPETYGANATDAYDDTAAIQQAINLAQEKPNSIVQFSSGTYRVDTTLRLDYTYSISMKNSQATCKLVGTGYTQIMYTNTSGALIHVGQINAIGMQRTVIKDIELFAQHSSPNTTGVLLEHAGYGIIEGCFIHGFGVGVHNKGSIGTLIDGKKRRMANSTNVLIESSLYKDNPEVEGDVDVKYASNMIHIMNYHFSSGSGVKIQANENTMGDPVNNIPPKPAGSGGSIIIEKCIFEHISEPGAIAIDVTSAYEVKSGIKTENPLTSTSLVPEIYIARNNIKIIDNWFEGFGDTAIRINDSSAIIDNNYFAGEGSYYIYVQGKDSRVRVTNNANYGVDVRPTNNILVYFDPQTITPIKAQWSLISNNLTDCPVSNYEIPDIRTFKYTSPGYNDDELFHLKDLITLLDGKGTNRGYTDVVIMGFDGANSHHASLRVYMNHDPSNASMCHYKVVVLDTDDPTAFSISGTDITLTDGSGGWFYATFTVTRY